MLNRINHRGHCASPLAMALCISALLVSPALFAQERAPTQAQLELNQEGVQAIIAENYDEAIRLLDASITLGALNITHANLGRAHQRAGNCAEAEANYIAALTSPYVANPSRSQISETVESHRAELREVCPGTLNIVCEPEQMEIFINDEGPFSCAGLTRDLEANTYTLRGILGTQETSESVKIESMETTLLQLVIEPSSNGDVRYTIMEIPIAEKASPNWLPGGYWLAGAGATLITGVLLDTLPAYANDGQVTFHDYIPIGFYVVGAGALIYGIVEILR